MRCSSLPLLWICPGVGRTDDGVLVDAHNEASEDGTACHRLMASWPDGEAPKECVDELSEEARIGYYTAAKMWREQISAWMPASEAEVEVEADGLTGHIDVLSVDETKRKAAVVDWKTGRKDASHKHQGFGYAFLVLRDYAVDEVTVHFAWARTQELESYTVSRARAEQWNRERIERIEHWDGKYTTGDHCAHCPRGTACPARSQLVRSEVEALTGPSTPDVTAMEPAQLVDFHRRLKVLETVLKSAQSNVRAEVEKRGEVLSDDGHVLHLVEENGPRAVDTLKAWPALSRELEREELASCLTVSIGDVEQIVSRKAGRGNGAQAKRALAAELEAAGAVTQVKQFKLKLERVK